MEPTLHECSLCGNVTPRTSGICTNCIRQLIVHAGEHLIVTTMTEEETRRNFNIPGRTLGRRLFGGPAMAVYATLALAGFPREDSGASNEVSTTADVEWVQFTDNSPPVHEPEFEPRKTAWERRNLNQPFYAAISNKRKRRR